MKAPYVYNAVVERVVDGDTIVVTVDWGFRRRDVNTPIRLSGINAREVKDPGGHEAKSHLEKLLPVGTEIVLETAKPDMYNPRWVANVMTDFTNDLSTYLIEEEWAAPYFGFGVKAVPPWPRTKK